MKIGVCFRCAGSLGEIYFLEDGLLLSAVQGILVLSKLGEGESAVLSHVKCHSEKRTDNHL
jgi:hypothetical protein